MFPLGTFAWFGYSGPLEKRLELIGQAGFETTCLWFGHEEEMVRNGRADDMPKLVRDKGLTLDNIHAPFWHASLLWSESAAARAKAREELTTTLAFCGKHQIPIMVVHPAGGDDTPFPNQSGLRLIRDLVKQAEDSGVTIALENLDEAGFEHIDLVFSNVQSPNLGFCYDSGHDVIARQFRGRALERWGHLLVTTHLSDNYGTNDDHLPPGRGTIDWQAVGRGFPQNRYKGALLLEAAPWPPAPHSPEDPSPEEHLRAGYQWLRRFEKTFG